MENAFNYFCNGACCTFFVYEAYFYFLRRKQQRFYRTCAYIMIFWAILLIKDPFYLIFEHNKPIYDLLMLIDMSALFTCSFYCIELLSPQKVTWKRISTHTAPYLITLAIYTFRPEQWAFNLSIYGMSAYCVIIICYLIRLTIEHKKAVANNFSDTNPADIRWLWQAVSIFLVLLSPWILICYYKNPITDGLYYLAIIAVWGLSIYHTHRQNLRLSEVRSIMTEDLTQEKPDKQYAPNFDKEVEELFHHQKTHRDPHLTLARVALLIGTNRNYFSYYLNNTLNVNFSDFINGFRLEDAEQMLNDPNCNLSQDSIAQNVGFNSLSTFRRAFFKKHGITPSQYRKALHNKQQPAGY